VRIDVLGPVAAWRGDTPVPLRGVRLSGLLARLALDAGRPVGTSVLVDDLWGESPPDGAGNALQALVSRLRRAIGTGLVATDPRGYRLCVEPDAVDVLRFGSLVAAAATSPDAHDLLGQALALWRGPALADVAGLPFAGPVAARLGERRAVVVEDRAKLALRLGRTAGEIDALTAQLDAQPLRETTAALLTRCLQAADRQADALAVADHTIARLADELGVDPGPQLAATRLAVLRGELPSVHAITQSATTALLHTSAVESAAAPAGRPVHTGLSSFVGRTHDVDRVRALLGGARLVTLTGPGGAGKTRLAREAVGGGTAVVAELAPLTGPEQLATAVLAAVGEPELVLRAQDEMPPDIVSRLVAAISPRETLLVLDNCEHLVEAVAELAETLLHACPRLRVLATSREPLGVAGEILHPVDALAEADAVALFADRAAAVRPGFTVSPEVAAICRRLDGQPLPIELAAARLRTLTPEEILERLDDRFRLLTSGSRTAVPRHQTLRAVVDWSWDLLAEPERAVARRLGVFAGGATAAAAQQVCGGWDGEDTVDVFELLAALVDKSLVVAVPGSPTRYRMLETIRAYAGERLDQAGERDAAVAGHGRVVLELVEAAEPHLRRREQLSWLAQLRAEADEIDIALRRAVAAGDAPTAHRFVAALTWSWIVRGRTDEADRWVTAVHELDGPIPPDVRARNLGYLAVFTAAHVDSAAATRHVESVVALTATLPRPWHPLLQLVEPIYRVFARRGDDALVALSSDAEDPWVRGVALQVRAQIEENEGRRDTQRMLVRTAHEVFVEIGDRFGLGMIVHALGELEDTAGNYAAAAQAYDEAIALAAELGNTDDLPQFLSRRADLEARFGNIEAARELLRRADPPDTGSFGSAGSVATTRAKIERLGGNLDAARAQLTIATAEFEAAGMNGVGVPQRRAFQALSWATVELAAGDLPAARARVAEAVTGAVAGGDGPVSAVVAEVAAQLALAEGDPECACLLLGVAAAQRGTIDLGSPDVAATLDSVRAALGRDVADRRMSRGQDMPRADGVARLVEFAERPDPRPLRTNGRSAPLSAPRRAR